MKKLLFLVQVILLTILGFPKGLFADIIEYPFDEISIIAATKFEITVDEEPSETSVLYGHVEVGDTLTIYIGELKFIMEGIMVEASPSIMIVTTEDDTDILRWLVNSAGSDLETYEARSYASWILVDPEIGVVKDLSLTQMEVTFNHNLVDNTYTFTDNTGHSVLMNSGSLVTEEDLSIIISAYTEVTP